MTKIKIIIGVAVLALATELKATDWIGFAQSVGNSKQLTATIYPSYAPGLTLNDGKKAEWGFGAAAMYPVGTDHLMAGARLDWLADQFWTPSVTISPNAQVQILEHDFTVFGLGGAVMPLGNVTEDNGKVGATLGAGIYTTVWQPSANTSLQVWAAYERWTPVLDINIFHASAAFTIKF